MALLSEYAITPDVFDSSCHSSEEVCELHLQSLKDVLLSEALVRDLQGGEWSKQFMPGGRAWHPRTKELFRKLSGQSRLICFQSTDGEVPASDLQWCDEALATHAITDVRGIIATEAVASSYTDQPIVSAIDGLKRAGWWTSRSPSYRLRRTLADYRLALDLVLRHANSIQFVDPHLDPALRHYGDFMALVQGAGGRTPAPLIELHRVAWFGSSRDKRPRCEELETSFRQTLTAPVQAAGLTLEVFLWDDFHDRYLISNLIGIHMGNGFDTTSDPNAKTTWSRLGRDDLDDVLREFEPANNRHALRAKFIIE